jgi:hypothetical protein
MKTAKRTIAMLATGLSAALIAGGTATAEDTQRTWSVIAEARGVSPYAEVPSEQAGGGPFVRAQVDSTNFTAPAYAFGTLGYPSYLAQEGALVVKDKPGDVNASSSPDSKYTKSERFAPFGTQGPYVAVETPDDLTAQGIGSFRILEAGDMKADGGFSQAKTFYAKELNAMVAEATSHMNGLHVGSNLSVANFDSFVRLTLVPDAEPKVDYRLSLSGISAGGKEAGGWSTRSDAEQSSTTNRDLVISGQGIGIGKIAEDFANKMNGQEIPNLMKGGLFINKPRVTEDDGGYFKLEGAALELRSNNTQRKSQFGQAMGIRFGDTALWGLFRTR